MVPLVKGRKDQEILFHTTGTGLYSAHLGGAKIIFLLSGLWSELNVPTVVISSHPAIINSEFNERHKANGSQLQLYRP